MKQNTYFPLVSIIIPVYNGANYLKESIDSALAQTYKNIEIIVVNDGSKDNGKTEEIALSYGDQIRYFSKENGGCASALNVGIKNMKGEYFSWLSHDDLYYPNKIEHQVNILNKLDNKNIIIYGGYELIDEKSQTINIIKITDRIPENKLNISLFPLFHGLSYGCTLLIPAIYFKKVGLFNESLKHTQDYDLFFKIFRIAKIHFDPQILVKCRQHSTQSSRVVPNNLEECEELWARFLKELTEEEMLEMGGCSITVFLFDFVAFLKCYTPYKKSEQLALEMANRYLNNTKVSVIIPLYNRINWTIEAIESVLIQTHQNFEVLVIDDGSTDDVSKLIEICKKDKRIKYFRRENEGVSAARNFGIEKAKGEYIAFLDSDDLFMPNKIETQLRFMVENDRLFSHTSYQKIDEQGKYLYSVDSGDFFGQIFPQIINYCPIAVPTVMGRTSLFRQNLFPENIRNGEDFCVWISIASKNQIGGINKELSKVRITSTNTLSNPRKHAESLINTASYIINDPYLSKYSLLTVNLLSRAITELKSLEKEVDIIEDNPSNVINKTQLNFSIIPSLIRLTIYSIKYRGVRATISKIKRWFEKHRNFNLFF
ncbi:glycosyltransferase family 2 protein [Rickettsia endosymbiont of Gonocerus acuteangulatus]|uniref:glycosyltransferase family 2 protein n=1 Tax=Rickettsia endosymbiont of Gonocerus acuteangulatus TaxID=3066266 RepID=UPI003133418B